MKKKKGLIITSIFNFFRHVFPLSALQIAKAPILPTPPSLFLVLGGNIQVST